MAVDLSALQAEVARNTSVDASAVALINGIADKIAAAIAADDAADAANINALVDELRASTDGLSGAVVANTPAEEPAPEEGGGEPA